MSDNTKFVGGGEAYGGGYSNASNIKPNPPLPTDAENFVLQRFPDAFCYYDEPDFAIIRRSNYKALGVYKSTAISAWADAANRIEQGKP